VADSFGKGTREPKIFGITGDTKKNSLAASRVIRPPHSIKFCKLKLPEAQPATKRNCDSQQDDSLATGGQIYEANTTRKT
jgi:hypothetical protein